jgi:O-antigen/teichoic acid export membrane protein
MMPGAVLGRESLAASGIVSLVGSAIAALSALVLTAVIGNGLGASGTGLFFQAVAIFTIASQVLRLGTNSAIIRSIAARSATSGVGDAWRTTLIAVLPVLLVSAIAGAAMLLFAGELAAWLSPPGASSELQQHIVTLAPFVAVGAVLAVLQTVSRMVRGVVTFTVLQSVLLPLSRLIAIALALALALGTTAIFAAWLWVLPVWLLVTVAVVTRPLVVDARASRRLPRAERTGLRGFWAFSAPRAVGASLETALDWTDVLIVAALTSPAEAGIYVVATRTLRAGQVVDRAMRVAVSPTISRLLALGELDEARALHTSVARLMILATWPYYLVLAVLGPAVLQLFGDGFAGGVIVLAILAAAMMVSAASGILQSVLLQGGRSSWQMANKTVVLAINVSLNLLLVPLLGIVGAAISWVVSLIVDTAIAAWQVHRGMGVRLQPAELVRAALVPLVVFGIGCTIIRLTAGASLTALAVGLPLLLVVYLASLWLLQSQLGIDAAWLVVGRLARGRDRRGARDRRGPR